MQNNIFFGHSEPATLIVLDKISSTNDYLKQLLSNFKPQLPFTAIMTKHQTEGRGQRGTTWIASPGKNLTASFLNSPTDLLVTHQFTTTITSSLAVYDVLKTIINTNISIKWPNDIMVNNKKIAGILIENKVSSIHVKHSIIGIGINVYSTEFPSEITLKTTSIILENFDFNLTIIDLIRRIQNRLLYYESMVTTGKIHILQELYINKLFRKGIAAKYLVDENEITGTIMGVQADGKLILKVGNSLRNYDLKDVTYQL